MSNKKKAKRGVALKSEYALRVVAEPAFPWESQHRQYPEPGQPGIQYMEGPTPHGNVDCLLFYDDDGLLRGVLNHYPFSAQTEDGLFLEVEGNVNVFVDPDYRGRGVATALLNEAVLRWPFDVEQQTYTFDGVQFIQKWLARHRKEASW